MSNSLDLQILDLHHKIKRRTKILQRLRQLRPEIKALQTRIELLDKSLIKAGLQIERWQKKLDSNLYQFFFSLFQDKEELEDLMEEENHQYYLKIMKLKDMQQQLELLLFEKKVLEEKTEEFQHLEYHLKKLMNKREKLVSQKTPQRDIKKELGEEQENIFFQRMLIKEMEEALRVGTLCKKHLDELLRDLGKVHDQDRFEMSGQGRYSSQDKKKFGKRLKDSCHLTGQELRQFNIQLKDISQSLQLDYEEQYEYFERFTENIYDILISSSSGRSNLKKVLLHLNHLRNDVIKLTDRLLKDIEKAEESIKKSELKKEYLILLDINLREKKG